MDDPRVPGFSCLNQIFGQSVFAPPPPAPKRSVFVSYHHWVDQGWYKDFTRFFCEIYDVIDDTSPERAKDSDDADYIMWSLRNEHIKGSSCTIVLCGPKTFERKFVDWEIAATLDKKHGLIGVWLPICTIGNLGRPIAPNRLCDNVASGYAVWITWGALVQGGVGFLREQIEIANATSKSLIQNDREKMGRCSPSLTSILQWPPSLLG
jgi:hypothetical protein